MCFGLDVFGVGKAAKKQAKATMDSANMQASSDREVARGNVLSMQATLAQSKAADLAAELLGKPQENAQVILSPEEDAPTIDPETGRRVSRRAQFFNTSTSGINI